MTKAIITPVYEDAEAAGRFFRELRTSLGRDAYVIAIDDGSLNEPLSPGAIAAAGLHGAVIRLKRNVGHQRAIAVGIDYAAAHLPSATCIVMDCDGEDVPSTIPQILEPLESEEYDVVVARRKNRVETMKFKVFYAVYKVLFRLMTGHAISFGNFMALKPAAVKRLSAMPELGIHVAGCVLVSRLRVSQHPTDRGPRYAGRSKMNFSGLVLHGFQAFMVFAEHVLVRVGIACASVAVLALAGILASVALKFLGLATPGWASTVFGLLVLVLCQTGIITLMTLMLAGIAKANNLLKNDYLALIEEVAGAEIHAVAAE